MIEDAHHVNGDGVCAFWFVRCNSVDSNTRTLRTDFLVRHFDMTEVRLHPQSAKNKATGVAEAIPVYGSWKDWRPGAAIGSYALAVSQGTRQLVRDVVSIVGFEG